MNIDEERKAFSDWVIEDEERYLTAGDFDVWMAAKRAQKFPTVTLRSLTGKHLKERVLVVVLPDRIAFLEVLRIEDRGDDHFYVAVWDHAVQTGYGFGVGPYEPITAEIVGIK